MQGRHCPRPLSRLPEARTCPDGRRLVSSSAKLRQLTSGPSQGTSSHFFSREGNPDTGARQESELLAVQGSSAAWGSGSGRERTHRPRGQHPPGRRLSLVSLRSLGSRPAPSPPALSLLFHFSCAFSLPSLFPVPSLFLLCVISSASIPACALPGPGSLRRHPLPGPAPPAATTRGRQFPAEPPVSVRRRGDRDGEPAGAWGSNPAGSLSRFPPASPLAPLPLRPPWGHVSSLPHRPGLSGRTPFPFWRRKENWELKKRQ